MKSPCVRLWVLLAGTCMLLRGEARRQGEGRFESGSHDSDSDEGYLWESRILEGRGGRIMELNKKKEDSIPQVNHGDSNLQQTSEGSLDALEAVTGKTIKESQNREEFLITGENMGTPNITEGKSADPQEEAETEMNWDKRSEDIVVNQSDASWTIPEILKVHSSFPEYTKDEMNIDQKSSRPIDKFQEGNEDVSNVPEAITIDSQRVTGMEVIQNITNLEMSSLQIPESTSDYQHDGKAVMDVFESGDSSEGQTEDGGGWVPYVPQGRAMIAHPEIESEKDGYQGELETTEGKSMNRELNENIRSGSDELESGDGWMLYTPGGGPLDSRCPCLPKNICPRAYGASAADMLLLGHLPICQEESKIRCCGASVRTISRLLVTENAKEQQEDLTVHTTSTEEDENTSSSEMDRFQEEMTILSEHILAHNENQNKLIETDVNITAAEFHCKENCLNGDVVLPSPGLTEDNENSTNEHTLSKPDSEEISEKEIEEYFKPDMLTFLEGSASGLIQKSEQGNLMIVTPVPLTARKKYQQQMENKYSDSTKDNVELNSYIKLKNVMHVTHRPEKYLTIVTPQPTIQTYTENSEESSTTEQSEINEKQFNTKSVTSENLNLMDNEKDQYSDFDKLGLLSQPSEKVEIYQTKEFKENSVKESSHYLKDGKTKVMESVDSLSKKELRTPIPEVLMDQKQNLDQVSFSRESQKNINREEEIQRTMRENANRRFSSRNSPRPKWSPMRITKKQPATFKSPNSNQGSFYSAKKDINANQSENPQNLMMKSEDTGKIPSNRMEEKLKKELKINPVAALHNLRSNFSIPKINTNIGKVAASSSLPQSPIMLMSPVASPDQMHVRRNIAPITRSLPYRMEIKTEKSNSNPILAVKDFRKDTMVDVGNVKHVIQVAPFPGSHMVQIHPVIVQIEEYPYFLSKMIPISSQTGHSNLPISNPKKLEATAKPLGLKMIYTDPSQVEGLNAKDDNKESRLAYIRNGLMSLFHNLQTWQASNTKLSSKAEHPLLENLPSSSTVIEHTDVSLEKIPNSPTIQLKTQELHTNLKDINPYDEYFGKRIAPINSYLNINSKENVMPNNGGIVL